MTDFPNLNMSIGEYYKLLMEGKRPTRSRGSQPLVPPEPPKPAIVHAPPHPKPQKKESQKGAGMDQAMISGEVASIREPMVANKKREEKDRFK